MPSSSAQRVGTIAEVAFMRECLERNFEPHSTTTPMPWDFLVTSPTGIHKVQVKATAMPNKGRAYKVMTGAGCTGKDTMSDEIDVVACYILPLDLWWIIPRVRIGVSKTINLCPDPSSTSRFKKYQNNWSIFYK